MYARTPTTSYPARNMQNYSYSENVNYPKGPQNTQQTGYGDHQNYMESNQSYGARKDGRAQQSGYSHGYQEDDTYGNMPSSSYDQRQGYQETEYHDQGYMEDKRDNRKGSWNTSSWDMNRGSNYSSSESGTYQEASSSYQQQQQHHNRYGHGSWGNVDSRANGSGVRQTKTAPYANKDMKFKGPPKPQQQQQQQQLHYCEICKISCAGYQTYKEHLEGQKHKKKEQTVAAQMPARGTHTPLHCQLCDISCTGPDAYAAHIKGAKHQKVVKLHTRLGKPIPDSDPVVSHTSTAVTSGKTSTFNSSGMQNLDNSCSLERSANAQSSTVSAVPSTSSKKHLLENEGRGAGQDMLYENPVKPVGESYVEEVHNEDGKVIRFHCKLCECSFNDSNARDMHLKGRRHRLQYKKKVNPRLPVEVKSSNRPWKMQEDKIWRRWEQKKAMQRYLQEEQMWLMEMRRYEDMYRRELEEEYMFWEYQQMRKMNLEWPHMGRGVPPYSLYGMSQVNESKDDQYIMRKHAQIYPTEKELQAIQKTVLLSERALKLVSDRIKEEASAKYAGKLDAACLLRGVKRVGILAKGLILRGNQDLHLTLICSNKPTCNLLMRIAEILPEQLEKLSKKQHTVTYDLDEAHLLITFLEEPKMNFTVSFTCSDLGANKGEKKENVEKEDPNEEKKENVEKEDPNEEKKENVEKEDPNEVKNDNVEKEDPNNEEKKEHVEKEDANKEKENVEGEQEEKVDSTSEENILLNEEKCKESLVHLRQAQWFQVHVNNLKSSVIVIRIFHDLRRREPIWKPLHDWALEVIIEKALRSASLPLSPADATRRVLECIAFGVLLPDGPELKDPCQKEPCDVLELLTNQEREDITASAQRALRLMSFRQIYKVLGMEPLQSSRINRQKRKRPRDSNDVAKGDEKKDKKENTEQTE